MIKPPAQPPIARLNSWRHSIRFRMVLAFSLLSAALLLAIQTIQFYGLPLPQVDGSLRVIRSHEFDMLAAVADSRKKLITDWITSRRRTTQVIATLPALRVGRLQSDPQLRKPFVYWLEEMRTTYQLDAIRILDARSGAVILSAPTNAGPLPLTKEQFAEAAQPGTEESILLSLGQDEGTSHLHLIRQVVPEQSSSGLPELLVEVEYSLETLLKPQLELHMQALLGKSGEITLIDDQGRFLTTTRYRLPNGQPVRPLRSENTTRTAQLALSGGEGTLEDTDYRNVEVLAAYRHIQLAPGVSWGVVVQKDRSEAFSHLYHQRNLFFVLSAAGVGLIIILAILISHRMTRPLRRMAATSRSISEGDLTARVAVDGDSETIELAQAFNSMLDQLNAWHSELDLRVQQRTAELETLNHALQNEVNERTQAENALHEKTLQLEEEIGERQKAQEALQLLNSTLEQRIDETVTQLRQKDDLLIQQNRMAALGELLTNIAHQWRQPLNNIAVYIQTMQYLHRAGELTDEEMDRDIKAVMDILQYMSQTIDDFRSFFVRDRNNTQEFALAPTIAKALTLVTPALTANNIKVVLLKDERQELRVNDYPNEFIQVVMNILYNARDIMLERQVVNASIEIMVTQENGKNVTSIRDNGGGIDQQALPHIFDPYFTTKGPDKGTGIGLYMSKTIIEKNMGGKLTARNLENGAEFRIEL